MTREATGMKKQWGRWLMDTKSHTLSYENGRLWRIFTIPPSAALTPGEIVAWISRRHEETWLEEADIQDLILALEDLRGRADLQPPGPMSH